VLKFSIRGWVVLLVLGGALLATVGVQAQSPTLEPTTTPTAMILGAVNVPLPTPVPDDPRPAICAAPYLSGFVPVLVRPGDTLANLMIGVTNLSITQIAALNCIDDPDALPIGAVIWLPGAVLSAAQPAATAAPTAAAPAIQQLRVSQTRLNDNQSFTATWTAAGAAAYFYACPTADPDAACSRPLNALPLPLTHTTAPISGFFYAGEYRYRLEVVGGTSAVTRDVTVQVACAQKSLGAYNGRVPCPLESAQVATIVWQPFERGQMWWFAEAKQIWALTEDGRVQVFEDTFVEGDSSPTAVPPEGRQTPVRGFGQVWQQLGEAQGAMGWALAAESGGEVRVQPASRTSYTRFFQRTGDTVLAITIAPEQREGWWVALH
jgi:hypothetical protein